MVYADKLLSAADEDVVRPEFERLRAEVKAGNVAHIWCVEQSRLQRIEVGWFVLAAELVAAGIDEVHTNRDGIVRVADDIAGIKAVLSAGEVRKLKKRVNDRLADNAAMGLPAGSLPFGYRHGVKPEGDLHAGDKTYLIVPEQADAIRWAAQRVLAGWSLASIAAALREQGMTGGHKVTGEDGTLRYGRISVGSVRSWLTKPTVAGWCVHRSLAKPVRGNWEPILDEATWQSCKAKLSGPREVTRAPNPDGSGPKTYPVTARHTGFAGRKYLLTGGLARCGALDEDGKECGHAMVGALKQLKGGVKRGGRDVAYLSCHPSRGGKGCTGIFLAETEQYVLDRLWQELDKPEFLDAIAEDGHADRRDEITTALTAIEAKRREVAALWALPAGTRGALTSAEWQAARQALDESEADLRAELADKAAPPARVNIAEAKSSWPHMNLGEQREFVRLFVQKVAILRATPGQQGYDSTRVVIDWKSAR